jgi:hypothetical protein
MLLCMCSDVFNASLNFEMYLLNFLRGAAVQDHSPYAEYARYCLARFEEALDIDESALENLIFERSFPSEKFIYSVWSGSSNPYRCSTMVAGRRPWQPAQETAS